MTCAKLKIFRRISVVEFLYVSFVSCGLREECRGLELIHFENAAPRLGGGRLLFRTVHLEEAVLVEVFAHEPT